MFESAPQPMDLTARAGLTLVTETMLALGMEELVEARLPLRERQRGYSEFDKLHALVLVQAAGGDCVEDARILPGTPGGCGLVDRPWPSPDALHDFLTAFHDEEAAGARPADGAWIPAESPALRGLAEINQGVVQRAVAGLPMASATLDLDATVIESHKSGTPCRTLRGGGGTSRRRFCGPSKTSSWPISFGTAMCRQGCRRGRWPSGPSPRCRPRSGTVPFGGTVPATTRDC